MLVSFNQFLQEQLHPEIQHAISTPGGSSNRKSSLVRTMNKLASSGEDNGIDGDMPTGSSRAYLKHKKKQKIILDGKPTEIHSGTKVAIKAHLDKFHQPEKYDHLRLGALQNRAEGSDHFANQHYRILTKESPGRFKSNKENGIFPPLLDYDKTHHEWIHIGHARDLKNHAEFRELTKTKSHPKGISHKDFVASLNRYHGRNRGTYWDESAEHEKHLDKVSSHPLVQKFEDYHGNTGASPNDYSQIRNLGVFHHPDGSKHIIARDHGFDAETEHAYDTAQRKQAESHRIQR